MTIVIHNAAIVTVDDAMDIDKEQDANQLARFGGTSVAGGNDLDVHGQPNPDEHTSGELHSACL